MIVGLVPGVIAVADAATNLDSLFRSLPEDGAEAVQHGTDMA